MNKVSVSGDDLRRFARELRNFSSGIESSLSKLQSQFSSLDWDDDQQRKFETEFQRSVQSMRSFLRNIEQYAPTLERKARALDEYRR